MAEIENSIDFFDFFFTVVLGIFMSAQTLVDEGGV